MHSLFDDNDRNQRRKEMLCEKNTKKKVLREIFHFQTCRTHNKKEITSHKLWSAAYEVIGLQDFCIIKFSLQYGFASVEIASWIWKLKPPSIILRSPPPTPSLSRGKSDTWDCFYEVTKTYIKEIILHAFFNGDIKIVIVKTKIRNGIKKWLWDKEVDKIRNRFEKILECVQGNCKRM